MDVQRVESAVESETREDEFAQHEMNRGTDPGLRCAPNPAWGDVRGAANKPRAQRSGAPDSFA